MSATSAAQPLEQLLRSWTRTLPDPSADGLGRLSTSARLALPVTYPAAESPGAYPFTRGTTERGYLDGYWVMGMYSGYASPSQTNARFRQLLDAGQTGLSIALDLPTQMGMDSDHPLAAGEIGKVGVPLCSVEHMKALIEGLPFERIRQMRTSANAIGPIFVAFLLVALEELGADPGSFRMLMQNDPLKEYTARGTFMLPPPAALRLAVDVIEYFADHHPTWEPIEFCGYHFRDAGGTAVQEIAFATANGIAYLDEAERRGVDLAVVAPTLYLFLNANVDIFEEAAKLRATRRLWARLLHERYGVPQVRARINIFSYTAGAALTAQEPLNNAVRVTCETLGAVLGGIQTLATSSFDEALGLPSSEAAHLALRTQQIVAHESGATKVVDPLAGSYYVEDLTDRLEAAILTEVLRIVEAGGAVAAIETGLISRELSDAAYDLQQRIESGQHPVVGVNVFRTEADDLAEAFRVPADEEERLLARLTELRGGRDSVRAERAVAAVAAAAQAGENTIPPLLEAARARATLGEIAAALKNVFGEHRAGGAAW